MTKSALSILGVFLIGVLPVQAQRGGGGGPPTSGSAEPLRFQYMGPPSGGRVASIAGVPGDTLTYYLGAASGGVWKTTDGWRTFTPLFDNQPVQAIGSLAVARSNPNIVWAGTGEAWAIRDSDMMGDGVYKSEDAGKTWKNMGLRETGRIGRILVNPTDPNIVFVCALGRTTGPQQERGVYRTKDGGTTWERVLFVNPNTGCSGIALDMKDPNVLYAGTWEVVMHTWAMFSGGPGSGVYVTRDGGTKWTKIVHPGLPKAGIGKVDVAVAASDPKRVYALMQTANQGSLWRSDDAGASWRVVSWDRTLIGRAGYYIRIEVNPFNPDEVLVASSSFHRSTDGGLTFPINDGGCGDCHDIWMDPLNTNHWAVTGDGGAGFTKNHGQNFTQSDLPIGQNYHVAIDNRTPYWVYSNRQDDGTMRGPANAPWPVPNVPSYLAGGKVGIGGPDRAPQPAGGGRGGRGGGRGGGGGALPDLWQPDLGGCESGFTIPDLDDTNIVWATCYGAKVTRYDDRLKQARNIEPGIHTLDAPPTDTKYRCHWTAPLALDPFDQKTAYYGCQLIMKTSNGGQSWTEISPDLSTKDPRYIVSSGGVVADNLGQFFGEVVFAIAPSELQRGLIWAGTNDGQIWNTTDGGTNWTNVTKNVTGMPAWGTIRKIEPSRFEAGTAYVVADYHLMDNRQPFLYKTTDFGKTWTNITGDLPRTHPLDYAMSIAENPNKRGMLFAGTGHAFYYSMDDGAHWQQFSEGLPSAPVTWIVVQKRYHDVVLSTYGRGIFILHDITRLEQPNLVAQGSAAQLYAPRVGVRQARGGGAELLFGLKAQSDTVQLDIMDQSGAVVRTLKAAGNAGLNRANWDLRYEAPKQVALRTLPPDNPHIWEEARFKGRDTRPINHWGIQGAQRAGPIAAPGKYTVKLTANGQAYTQPLEVIKDPALPTPEADLVASTQAQIRIRDGLNATSDVVNQVEVLRKQLEDQLKLNAGKADVEKAIREFDAKALAVELQLLSKTDLHSDDKWFAEAYRVYMNLIWLNGQVGLGAGDVAGGAEYRPTDNQIQVLQTLEQQLQKAKTDYDRLMQQDLPAFNKLMSGKIKVIT